MFYEKRPKRGRTIFIQKNKSAPFVRPPFVRNHPCFKAVGLLALIPKIEGVGVTAQSIFKSPVDDLEN